MRALVLFCAIVACIRGQTLSQNNMCDASRRSTGINLNNADAIIGGIFDIRKSSYGSFACGSTEDNMQLYEAARFAIKKLNDANYVPGVKFGMKVYDTCSSPDIAKSAALDLFPQFSMSENECQNSNKDVLKLGLLGTLKSSTTGPAAYASSKFPVSMISPKAMATALSWKTTYPYFMRTSIPVSKWARVAIAVAQKLGWSRIILVHTDDDYGKSGREAVIEQAYINGQSCLAEVYSVKAGGLASDYTNSLNKAAISNTVGAVFFGEAADARTLLRTIADSDANAFVRRVQWIFSDVDKEDSSFGTLQFGKGIIYIGPKQTQVSEFKDYWVKVDVTQADNENPWLQDWYAKKHECSLAGFRQTAIYGQACITSETQRRNIFYQQQYVPEVIKAVYAYGKALKTAHVKKCIPASGMCAGLLAMTTSEFHNTYLKPVPLEFETAERIPSLDTETVRFDSYGDPERTEFMIYNYNGGSGNFRFEQVGSDVNGQLTLNIQNIIAYDTARTNALQSFPSSPCPGTGCSTCVIPNAPWQHSTYFEPGDLIIGGIIGQRYPGETPLTCGGVWPMGAELAIALRYGLKTIKSEFTNILPGVDIGSFLVDDCNSGDLAQMYMADFMSRRTNQRPQYSSYNLDPMRVPLFLETTVDGGPYIAEYMTGMKMPLISSLATHSMLKSDIYKYFSRTLPGDDKQTAAMAKLMSRMGWTYAQTIRDSSPYSVEAIKDFKMAASKELICVAQSHVIPNTDTDSDYDKLIAQMRVSPDAKAIVIFAWDKKIAEVFKAIDRAGAFGEFLIIAGETWASSRYKQGLEDVLEGSISMQMQKIDETKLLNYFKTDVKPSIMGSDLWFREYYEQTFNCYINPYHRYKYITPCSDQAVGNRQNWVLPSYAQYSVMSVYVAAHALNNTLTDFCGTNYNGICSSFRHSPNVSEVLLKHIKSTSFDGFEMRDGEGNVPWKIINYRRQSGGYREVGTYNEVEDHLQLVEDNMVFPKSSTSYASKCSQWCPACAYIFKNAPLFHIPGDIQLGALLSVHDIGPVGPFSCGDIKLTRGFQYAAAIDYAIKSINNANNVVRPFQLNGVTLGALMIDYCTSSVRGQALTTSLYSGAFRPNFMTKPYPVSKIGGWLTVESGMTVDLNDFMKELKLPIISSAATKPDLNANSVYPTFYRTVQGDDFTSLGLLKILKALNKTYVHVVYSDNDWGVSALKTFEALGQQEGICVIGSYMMSDVSQANQFLNSIVASKSQVVVTFLYQNHLNALMRLRQDNSVLFVLPTPFKTILESIPSPNVLNDTIALSIDAPRVDGFINYLKSLTVADVEANPYFKEYYQKFFQCNLPGENKYTNACPPGTQAIPDNVNFFQDNYVVSTINAVYAFAGAVDAVLKELCGEDYEGLCDAYKNDGNIPAAILRKMGSVTFVGADGKRVEFTNGEAAITLNMLRWNGQVYEKVASYAGASLIWDTVVNTTSYNKYNGEECNEECLKCMDMKPTEFTYIPGDILLGGLFDVHERAANPFSCGVINKRHGYQYLEAFQFALHQVNNKDGIFQDILPNVRLGGIGLDTCESAIRTGYTVSNIHSGRTILNKDGTAISPDDIAAYIGTYSSDRSQYVARILKTLKIAQISYKSSSTELLERNRYPYFLSTVPADDTLAIAILKLLANYDVSYVQIAHSDDSYGINGAAVFQKNARSSHICIAQTVAFPGNGTITKESARALVKQLIKRPNAHMVVVFAPTFHAELLLAAVAQNPDANGKIKFVGTDTWANQIHVIEGNKKAASGSLSINVEYDDIIDFDDYISSKSIASYSENPWFPAFYEEMQNCYLGDRNPRYPRQCSATSTSITLSSRYKQDPGLVNVMNAVYAAAFGLHKSLKEECGVNYKAVCESFRNKKGKAELIHRNTMDVKFKDASNKIFSFTDRGDGKKGYYYYQVAPTAVKEFQYLQVGSISTDGVLQDMANKLPINLNAGCDRPDVCTECPSIRNKIIRYMTDAPVDAEGKTVIVGIFSVHQQGQDEYVCGSLATGGGFAQAMAMLYAISNIGNDSPFTISGLAVDTCMNNIRVDQDVYNLLSGNGLCNSEFNVKGISANNIPAFLSQFTTNTYAASRVLAPLKISLLSSTATSDILSDQRRHNYFARTVPPDSKQMELIADILKQNGWTFFSLVFDKSVYATSASEMLKSYLTEKRLCAAYSVQVPLGISTGGADALIRQLDEYEDSNVVVLIGYDSTIMEILAAAKRLGKLDRFLWIGTDTWANNDYIVENIKGENVKAISVNMRNEQIAGFNNYMIQNLRFTGADQDRPANIPRHWFEEVYQKTFKCRLSDANKPLDFDKQCNKTWNLDSNVDIDRTLITDNYILHTISAVEAIVAGLRKFKIDHNCQGTKTLRECFDKGIFNIPARESLFQAILQTKINIGQRYNTQGEFYLNFTSGRFWDVGYTIYYFDGSKYNTVEEDDIKDLKRFTNSSCTDEFRCPQCQRFNALGQQAQGGFDMDKLYKTPRNYYHYKRVYDKDQKKYTVEKSYEWPIWVIVVAILTCIGILVTILVLLFLIISYPTFSGSTALGYMIILGILGIYGVNFAFFLPAAEVTCAARRLVMGIVYAIVFACLLVKSIDNWRFTDVDYTVRKYKGVTSACALFFSAICLVLVEAIIPIMWLILVHPTATHLGSDFTHDFWWCDPFDKYDEGLVLSFLYIMFLVIVTAIFSGLAWMSENNYYESRWIFISSIATAGCFLVWMVVTTMAGAPYRDPTIAVANLVNATALLICLPIRKMVLLISIKLEEKKYKESPRELHETNGDGMYPAEYNNPGYVEDVASEKGLYSDRM